MSNQNSEPDMNYSGVFHRPRCNSIWIYRPCTNHRQWGLIDLKLNKEKVLKSAFGRSRSALSFS